MTRDWFTAKIDAVDAAAEGVRHALNRYPDVLERVRAEWLAGSPMTDIAHHHATSLRERRVAILEAIRQYEHALFELRGAAVRIQIDDEGATLSDLAQFWGLTRQTVTRLYRGVGDRDP